MKKILLVYFSRTGTTRKLGELIAEKTGAVVEELKDTVNRMGVKGYLVSGRDAGKRRLTVLEPVKANLADYDVVIIGGPIWSWNMCVPVRTFLSEHKDEIKAAAFFVTMAGSGDLKAFKEMGEIINKNPIATLSLKTKEVVAGEFGNLEDFCAKIKG
jgi:flavodoxin